MCNFLLVITSNYGGIFYRFRDIDAQSYKIAYFPHDTLVWRSHSLKSFQLEFLDETYPAKTRRIGLLTVRWKLNDPNFNYFLLIHHVWQTDTHIGLCCLALKTLWCHAEFTFEVTKYTKCSYRLSQTPLCTLIHNKCCYVIECLDIHCLTDIIQITSPVYSLQAKLDNCRIKKTVIISNRRQLSYFLTI